MNVNEFARNHLYPYKTKGNEVVPTLCPYCKGGSSRDKETFALNTNKLTFNCKRGTCGKEGHFTQLCKDFGEVADKVDNYEKHYKPKQEYKKPVTAIKEVCNVAVEYLLTRKISKETMDAYSVGSDEKGNIVFPYHENGELVMIKLRPARKVNKGERKAWRETGGKPILWGMDTCDTTLPLVITEGEIDTLACYEAGVKNVVSVPSGSEDLTWLDLCWEWLQQFQKIILFGDNDEAGQLMISKLLVKLAEHKLYTVENKYKDANELLFYSGKEAVKMAVNNAKEVPIFGLLNLADVAPIDVTNIERCSTGIKAIDKHINGFAAGQISIWTGKRGEGKSTFLGQLMLEAIEQGMKVCAYSGELRAQDFQLWIHQQAAGAKHINTYMGNMGKEVNYVSKEISVKIKEWYRDSFYLYDNDINETSEESSILKIFSYAAKRYDCKTFLIDNLMTANFEYTRDNDFYRAQSNFVGKLKKFAVKYGVHIHLVAHPKKTQGDLENDDVSGTADITNRADNVFVVKRVKEEEKQEFPCDVLLKIKKNREYGVIDVDVPLNYCKVSRRLYMPNVGDKRVYGWDNIKKENEEAEKCPFW